MAYICWLIPQASSFWAKASGNAKSTGRSVDANATPSILPGKNAWLRKGDAFAHRNAAIATFRRFGRKLWKNRSGYHRRSLVGTKMHCIKRLGERVMSRTFERQVNELYIRAAILNRFSADGGCGIATSGGWGRSGLRLIYATAPN